MPTVFTCEQVEQADFRIHYVDACMLGDSTDQQKVLSNIWMLTERRGATGNGETVVYFTAFNPEREPVALLVMANNNGSWVIEDLFSGQAGAGSALARFAMQWAIRDYGATANREITLTSLNATSCAFWQKMGFSMRNPLDRGHGLMIYRVPNSRPATPAGTSA
ncbi:hypothetical protein FHW58_001216 [Duganella sp. 1224]|uniref:GNAT family N-acetyltransferase n=1 Tax=Duganella sp. 1224 TaxID=2587052 RepID=UPI0015CDDB4F|nr:GNAT family N-acetyltransferase [Duganella sp. 1224]NYE60064.1 hypothetical protein [Duganella sp. 1224]